MTIFDKEMQKALEADGEKLRQLTGENHGPKFTREETMTAAEWDEKYKVGIDVIVRMDDGELWHTKTRSEAWELSTGHTVIMLEGRSGCYLLDRVSPDNAPTRNMT